MLRISQIYIINNYKLVQKNISLTYIYIYYEFCIYVIYIIHKYYVIC